MRLNDPDEGGGGEGSKGGLFGRGIKRDLLKGGKGHVVSPFKHCFKSPFLFFNVTFF